MQIFASDPSPIVSAQALDDRRLNKMALETAQLLSSCLPPAEAPYKSSHYFHPATLWAKGSLSHRYWLLRHLEALCAERLRRQMNSHSVEKLILLFTSFTPPAPEPEVFYNGAANRLEGLDYRHLPTHDAYKRYLTARWELARVKPTWKFRGRPLWSYQMTYN